MGNQIGKCFTGGDHGARRRNDPDHPPHDDGLGHSFCYMRHDSSSCSSATANAGAAYPPFRAISGASISANVSTPPSTDTFANSNSIDKASAFESSNFFSSIPLQPIPRNSIPAFKSGPILRNPTAALGPIERGFLSGPIERSFLSGPLENHSDQSQRFNNFNNNNHPDHGVRKSNKWGFPRNFKMALSKPFWGFSRELRSEHTSTTVSGNSSTITSNILSSDVSLTGESDDLGNESFGSQNVQWAQGKAGEDRVHVVISEEHGWIFVGIYDGFNGPDATDFLLQNLYINVYKELKGLLWWEKGDPPASGNQAMSLDNNERVRVRLDRILREKLSKLEPDGIAGDTVNHLGVLEALSEGLRKTEASYLQITDMMLMENPELALMGSCVLGMVMKGDDVYLMNVGDSRVVLARKAEDDSVLKMKARFEETLYGYEYEHVHQLSAHQLTIDHSASIREEVVRIRSEHMDDPYAIVNDRVKGSLKVTRAFGAGYLKNPKWNDALLNVFRIDYIGSSPYISCSPSLCHHKLDPTDKFLILSSDGLYQYFTNDEAVAEVETFMSTFPEGDPAQHLVEEVLLRAAKKAGMDFHELIEIPQGDRRRYHDDVSIIIISFEGRIWRSSV